MGLFSGLEGSLEKYIEGFFKGKFGGRIQPVDIAKKLAREMRDAKKVSVSNVYAPNEYRVYLNPSEWENISNFASVLSRELEDYVKKKAGEKRYTLTGPPSVRFSPDETLDPGNTRIVSGFSEYLPQVDTVEVKEDPIENTQPFQPVKDCVRPHTAPLVYGSLQVDSGQDEGKVFNLSSGCIAIGRREDCDIVLNDTSVSRVHARLELHRGRYTLSDEDSTNGTWVNGVRITSKVLEPGDVISLGTTVCTFKAV